MPPVSVPEKDHWFNGLALEGIAAAEKLSLGSFSMLLTGNVLIIGFPSTDLYLSAHKSPLCAAGDLPS
ncbi:MAG: Uncharacterised protein [Chloroflexota bacterium]|nr:MAG: Uncharacterised protein [Chloroflexota bacterium]